MEKLLFVAMLCAGLPLTWVDLWGAPAIEPGATTSVTSRENVPPSSITATGSIKIRVGANVRVGTQATGVVKQLNVTVGARVERGDLIAVIEVRGLAARIDSARAQVSMAEVGVQKLQNELSRKRKLHGKGVIADEDLENLALDAKLAEATLAKAKADLSVQEADQDYLQIRAPIGGVVASISTLEGETVVSTFATPTFVNIIKPEALELVALVDETDIAAVEIGDKVRFTVESYQKREFDGRVTRIAPTATIVSGVVNYEVTVTIPENETPLLKPEMTANLSIEVPSRATTNYP